MNKDTFHTIVYKGCYIHSCHNRDTDKQEVQAQLMIDGY